MRVAQPKISTPLSGPTGTKTPTQLPRQAGGARSRANAWGTDHWHFQRNARGFASLGYTTINVNLAVRALWDVSLEAVATIRHPSASHQISIRSAKGRKTRRCYGSRPGRFVQQRPLQRDFFERRPEKLGDIADPGETKRIEAPEPPRCCLGILSFRAFAEFSIRTMERHFGEGSAAPALDKVAEKIRDQAACVEEIKESPMVIKVTFPGGPDSP